MKKALVPWRLSRRTLLAGLGATALALAGLRSGRAGSNDPVFLRDIEDLPLAPGLQEDTGTSIYFDKPGGRIAEATARGTADRTGVAAFYSEVLPALGWQLLDNGAAQQRWRRAGEILRVEFSEAGEQVAVRFFIAPE